MGEEGIRSRMPAYRLISQGVQGGYLVEADSATCIR